MESRSPNDSDGGGGRRGWSSPASGSLGTPHDEGRDGSPILGLTNVQPSPIPLVLSLDQIRLTWSSNEYTEGPTVPQRSPASPRPKNELVTSPAPRTNTHQETLEERPNNLRNLLAQTQLGNSHTSISSGEGVLLEDSRSSIRTVVGSASSSPRLLGSLAAGEQIIRTQPKHTELISDELKPLNEGYAAGNGGDALPGKHSHRCEDCGRCQCPECCRPRVLPSCWMCGRRCVCSAQSAVEYGTCVCCIKGLFYHCSSDDEDTCSDKPFSCMQSHCCVRWAAVSLLSLLFPCILCYLPAKGCVAACQSCYDRVTRPGCRCDSANRIHCEAVDKPT
ncbi:protein sprouty homolog 2 [Genypterus blacodes]|uniref:protein sprouty homolog 2 n=1 Tax=Genypterus blacodes TaxID=154954 RepID=UPI003F766EC1